MMEALVDEVGTVKVKTPKNAGMYPRLWGRMMMDLRVNGMGFVDPTRVGESYDSDGPADVSLKAG
jgi:hypothetical protein